MTCSLDSQISHRGTERQRATEVLWSPTKKLRASLSPRGSVRGLFLLIIISIALPSPADAWPWDKNKKADPNEAKKKQLAALNVKLQASRDKLQGLISARWKTKQKYVAQREVDKEGLAQLREAQERAYMEQSRVKKEVFAREKTIEDTRRKAEEAKETWKGVGLTLDDKLEKEAEKIPGNFPLDVEQRRLSLEKARDAETRDGELAGLDAYMGYFTRFIQAGSHITVSKQRILPENGSAVNVQLARFGSVYAYGMSEEGKAWVVTQTGRLGEGRFSVNPVVAPEFKASLTTAYPEWLRTNRVAGKPVMLDIIQNASSRNLISGKKKGREALAREYLKKGGATMIPLLLLPIWALLIIIYKFFQLALLQRRGTFLSRKVVGLLEKDNLEGARTAARKKWGAVARVIRTCLENTERGREATEQAVKETLLGQVPSLGRHLTTLAVIAGAAPLLGLLGTVTGMISLFEVITNYGTGDPKIMAAGISEALITTQTGLIVAIPILLVHNMLRNRKNRLQEEMERNAVTIMNRIWPGQER